MLIVKTIQDVRDNVAAARAQGKTIGFVPTMGALHVGHISLIEAAAAACDFVVVSVFVNPTQFGPAEDFDEYPRDLQADADICKDSGADIVFAPEVNEMYPQQNVSWVDVEKLTDNLCGAKRTGHFRGVTTVCTKLFNIVCPDKAFFGQKDAQQAAVITRMAADLNMPLEIVICPIVREADGLAVSSRNQYLTDSQRQDAPLIFGSLEICRGLVADGQVSSEAIIEKMNFFLARSEHIGLEYISITDAATLTDIDVVKGRVLVALAAKLGSTRLIDNIILDADELKRV